MSQTPNQKNIIHGSITAGENVHIGDKITHIINNQKLQIPVRLTNFIPTDASHVVGRDDELAETYQKISKNKPTVLVNGIGGIGKTTLALKYMVAYTPQYQHVAWLNAAAGVQSAFIQDTALLDALHLRRDVEDSINAAQPDKAFDLVFKRLNDLGENTEGGKKILTYPRFNYLACQSRRLANGQSGVIAQRTGIGIVQKYIPLSIRER
jgi:hypothetical protein